MGPGIVGTNTRLGFSGIEVGPMLDAASGLGGVPIACLRVSFADERDRHVGLSHHSATALRLAARDRVVVAVPRLGDPAHDRRLRDDLDAAGIDRRHDLVDVDAAGRARAVRAPRAAHHVDGPPRGRRSRAVPGRRRRGRARRRPHRRVEA